MSRILRAATAITLAVSLAVVNAQDTQPNPNLTDDEREELIRLLDDSFNMLLGLISGLSDEQWNFKQNPDRWSVGECTEHIVRSEQALMDFALTAVENGPDSEWFDKTKGKTDLLRRVMPNRNPGGAGGAEAPMEIRPTEKWDRAKAIQELYTTRGMVRAYVETLDIPIKQYTAEHPFPIFGWLTAHDWIIYVPLHTIRHSRQIVEVQQDENYPQN